MRPEAPLDSLLIVHLVRVVDTEIRCLFGLDCRLLGVDSERKSFVEGGGTRRVFRGRNANDGPWRPSEVGPRCCGEGAFPAMLSCAPGPVPILLHPACFDP